MLNSISKYNNFNRPLPLQIHQWDYTLAVDWNYRRHVLPYWRCYLTCESGPVIRTGNHEYRLCPETILLISPRTEINTFSNHDFHQFYIHFSMSWDWQRRRERVFEISTDNFVPAQLKHLTTERDEWSRNDFLNVYSFLARAASLLPENELNPPLAIDPRISMLLETLEYDNRMAISNPEMAHMLNLSENGFIKIFRGSIGCSPQEYLRRMRIERACQMLHFSEESIETIAAETGFVDRYHFSRVFKQIVGTSPAAFRREQFPHAPRQKRTSDPWFPK